MTEHGWLREYCEKTSSHCRKYLYMEHRSFIEKIFWILAFICMISVTIFVLETVINTWINNPTVLFLENTRSSIEEIPFPLIMICPTDQLRRSVWERHKDTNSSYWKHLQHYRSLICSPRDYIFNLENDMEFLDYDTIKQLVNDCAISCSEVFQSVVKWQNITTNNCCEFVQPIITIVGVCYTLNMMPMYQMFTNEYHQKYMNFFLKNNVYNITEKSKWNLDDGYSFYFNDNILQNVVPARTNGVSYYHSLKLTLHTMGDEFLSCSNHRRTDDGTFLITLANPTEYSSFDIRSVIKPETFTKIQITPFVKKINWDLRWRSQETRNCYLHNERKLSIFKLYTENNCHKECRINKTITMCGCIYFEAIFLVADGIKVCGKSKWDCILRAKRETIKTYMTKACQCWPTCSLVEYEILDTSHYDSWTYLRTAKLVTNKSKGSTVELVFKNPYFTAYKVASIVDLHSLISVIGGTLSLFLGINLHIIFEALYVIIQMISHKIVRLFN